MAFTPVLCGACRYWVMMPNDRRVKEQGECHLNPPLQVLLGTTNINKQSVHPVTDDDDWCSNGVKR